MEQSTPCCAANCLLLLLLLLSCQLWNLTLMVTTLDSAM